MKTQPLLLAINRWLPRTQHEYYDKCLVNYADGVDGWDVVVFTHSAPCPDSEDATGSLWNVHLGDEPHHMGQAEHAICEWASDAGYEGVAYMDDDAYMTPTDLMAMAESFHAHPEYSFIQIAGMFEHKDHPWAKASADQCLPWLASPWGGLAFHLHRLEHWRKYEPTTPILEHLTDRTCAIFYATRGGIPARHFGVTIQHKINMRRAKIDQPDDVEELRRLWLEHGNTIEQLVEVLPSGESLFRKWEKRIDRQFEKRIAAAE